MLVLIVLQVEALLNNFIERQKKRKVKRAAKAVTLENSKATVHDKNVEASSLSEQSDEEYVIVPIKVEQINVSLFLDT